PAYQARWARTRISFLTVDGGWHNMLLQRHQRTDGIQRPSSSKRVTKLCARNTTGQSIECGAKDFTQRRRLHGIPGRDSPTISKNAGDVLWAEMSLCQG